MDYCRIAKMHGDHIHDIVSDLKTLYPELPFKVPPRSQISWWASGPLPLSLLSDSRLRSLGVVAISIASPSSSSDMSSLGSEIEVAFMDSQDRLVNISEDPDSDTSQHFVDLEDVFYYIIEATDGLLCWRRA